MIFCSIELFFVTDKRVAKVGQHRHEHGCDARQPSPRQGKGKISLSVTAQRFRRWQHLLRLLLAAQHQHRLRLI